jgi:hypothetical protein
VVGGAWPFLVGGAICLVNSDNERDFGLLNSMPVLCARAGGGAHCLFGGSGVVRRRVLRRCLLLRGTSGVTVARN